MDYGDRQERAEMLIKVFRSKGQEKFPNVMPGRELSGEEVASEIENMTPLGKSLVAVAGFVIQAMSSTPEFFGKNAS